MNIKRTLPLLVIIFIGWNCFSQNDTSDNKYFSIGSKTAGICFGNSRNFNGLRLNLWDKESNHGFKESERINGINISFAVVSSVMNGLQIGGIGTYTKRMNGLSIASIWQNSDKMNGVAVSFGIDSDTLNGLFVGFGLSSPRRIIDNRVINGLAIGVFVGAEKIRGVAIGLGESYSKKQIGISVSASNKTEELHGLQIGLLNYAGNNPRLLRWLPLINFHL
jgi:hypothetical protein